MKNKGLFSTLFIEDLKKKVGLDDIAKGRMATLSHAWRTCNRETSASLWSTFVKQALSYLQFVSPANPSPPGVYPLYEDFGYSKCITVLYLVEPGSYIDEDRVGRFWIGKLIGELKKRKLNWGILADGSRWRLYSTKSSKPCEDYVELNLEKTLEHNDEPEYALFERFFHRDSFISEENSFLPEDRFSGGHCERSEAISGDCHVDLRSPRNDKIAGSNETYLCPLDLDFKASEKILEASIKSPLLLQIDEILQYVCNGFIADTPKRGDEYTEDERREIFESSVKLLYRCLFLFYAEARSLLPSDADKLETYRQKYSIRDLCLQARDFKWGKRRDYEEYNLWYHLKGLINAVNEGDPEYGIMGYDGGLFDDKEERFLGQHKLRNDFLSRALYLLAFVEPLESDPDKEYPIPYEDLEVRHLGELYENILEFNVTLADADRIRRRTKKGVETLLASQTTSQKGDTRIKKGDVYFGETALERKQTGSYYTPETLVRFLNEKAIVEPLRERFQKAYRARFDGFINEAQSGYDLAMRRGAAQSAVALIERFVKEVILSFKTCDPAMGSGHFLVNAGNQITGLIVELLSEIPYVEGMNVATTCQPNYWRRLVTRHCLYGVDLNPLAAHLAKLSLWLNCFAQEHKLTFLDHHIKCGNSLIGIRSLAQLRFLPDRNKSSKKKSKDGDLLFKIPEELAGSYEQAVKDMERITLIEEDDTDRQKRIYDDAHTEEIGRLTAMGDLYTAFLMDSTINDEDYRDLFNRLAKGERPSYTTERELYEKVLYFKKRHHFFYWPLEFPEVFKEGGGGFNAATGNPPWDVLEPSTQEFYIQYDPHFRKYKKQEALNKIKELQTRHTEIIQKWIEHEKSFQEASSYAKQLDAFTSLTHGKIDLYKAFLERFFQLIRNSGRMGIVIPSGLSTDQGCIPLRKMFFRNSRIYCLYGFENRHAIFNIHRSFKFILFCTEKGGDTDFFRCAFMQHDPQILPMIDSAALHLSPEHVQGYSPDSLNIMEFQSQRDIDIIDKIYSDWPLLGKYIETSWNIELSQEFNMSSDSHLFNTIGDGCPLYEGKLIWAFDHQFSPISY